MIGRESVISRERRFQYILSKNMQNTKSEERHIICELRCDDYCNTEQVKALILQFVEPARAEPGCLYYDLYQRFRHQYVLHNRWLDKPAGGRRARWQPACRQRYGRATSTAYFRPTGSPAAARSCRYFNSRSLHARGARAAETTAPGAPPARLSTAQVLHLQRRRGSCLATPTLGVVVGQVPFPEIL